MRGGGSVELNYNVYMIKTFLLVIGMFCLLLLLALVYLYILEQDRFEKMFCSAPEALLPEDTRDYSENVPANGQYNSYRQNEYNSPLSEEQLNVLTSLGVNASLLPTRFSTNQINCLEFSLGSERLTALINGALPTLDDVDKAEACLQPN